MAYLFNAHDLYGDIIVLKAVHVGYHKMSTKSKSKFGGTNKLVVLYITH